MVMLDCAQNGLVSGLNSGKYREGSVGSQALLEADLSLVRCQLDVCPAFSSKQLIVLSPAASAAAIPNVRLHLLNGSLKPLQCQLL